MNKKALRKHEKEIEKLRALIPQFPSCIDGCTDCCGHVHWSEWEWQQVMDNGLLATVNPNPFACPFSAKGNCDVYEHRPIVCRLFGQIDDEKMLCPHGIRPVKLMAPRLVDRILNKWDALIGRSYFSGRRTLTAEADQDIQKHLLSEHTNGE